MRQKDQEIDLKGYIVEQKALHSDGEIVDAIRKRRKLNEPKFMNLKAGDEQDTDPET